MLAARTIHGAVVRGVLIGLGCGLAMGVVVSLFEWWNNGPYLVAGAMLCAGPVGVGLCYPKYSSDL